SAYLWDLMKLFYIEIYDLLCAKVELLNKTAVRANKNITLTAKEFSLLEYLIKNKNRVLSETTINEALSSFEDSNMSNIVNVYIYRLRNKIDKDFEKKLIKTIRGIGFKISED
ncbi:winged helix-turn-helix domain-containing protein, partial [Aliarcobacter cryaerophilus]|uniref:winged helix-turn-helix domain-containing protein n=1 Tax=Aliarcobacter cryaerophilus TaxID=28198 RepID=UPI0021B5CDB6